MQRREFIQVGAATAAVASTVGPVSPGHGDEPKASTKTLPTRKLGKTGVDVTILTQGTWRAPGSLDRLLRYSYDNGVRYYDTAKSYGSEPGLKKWFQAKPEVRKDIFLVTKDSPRTPNEVMGMLDQRLEALGTDHIDLFFVHALGDHHSLDDAIEFASGKEFRKVADAIRKSGKAKFVGFSTHHVNRDKIIQAAADAGFVDAIMVQHTAWLPKDTALNKALDSCYAKGIGLISMKQIAGPNPEDFLAQVPKHVPDLKERGLTPFQGMLHAIWTDERIATCCVSSRSVEHIRENAEAARKFAPLKQAELDGLHRAFLASRPSLCADCDGRCGEAAGTKAALGDLTRYLTYHDRHGFRTEARRLYRETPEVLRDWKDADLAAAQAACPNKLDFAALLPEVERHLS